MLCCIILRKSGDCKKGSQTSDMLRTLPFYLPSLLPHLTFYSLLSPPRRLKPLTLSSERPPTLSPENTRSLLRSPFSGIEGSSLFPPPLSSPPLLPCASFLICSRSGSLVAQASEPAARIRHPEIPPLPPFPSPSGIPYLTLGISKSQFFFFSF